MPYLVASIISVVTAMVILFTRYEADDSTIKAELENMRVMFSIVDGFVNTYIESGGNLSDLSTFELGNSGILLASMAVTPSTVTSTSTTLEKLKTTTTLPNSKVIWQLIPNIADSSSYKVLVDIRGNAGLMSKAVFSEGFIGREFCEKNLFGTFETLSNVFEDATSDFINSSGSNTDGLLVCIVYK
jgi:hypothetical protein